MAHTIGEFIGGCRLEAQVAARSGYVRYRAVHPRSGDLRIVAVTDTPLADSPELHRIFTEEVQVAGILRHDHIARVFEGGICRGHGYMVQEYLPGGSLRDLIHQFHPNRRTLPTLFVLDLMRQIAQALAYAHNCGVVHGRVEPGNIQLRRLSGMLTAKLDNFGLARLSEEVLAVGGLNTTVHYLAPEQCSGEVGDLHSDVYGLGLTLYEALTGRPAFAGGSYGEVVRRQMSGALPSVRAIRPDVPLEVDALVQRCLALDPAQRPQRAIVLAAELAHLITPPVSVAAD